MQTEFTSQNLADLFQAIIIFMGAIFVARELSLVSRVESLENQLKESEDQLKEREGRLTQLKVAYRASLRHIAYRERPLYHELPEDPDVISMNAWKAERSKPKRKAL